MVNGGVSAGEITEEGGEEWGCGGKIAVGMNDQNWKYHKLGVLGIVGGGLFNVIYKL